MKRKVLIIEDDKDTQEIYAYLTNELDVDFEIRSEAIHLSEIIKINPDLILLDHWIGNVNGGDLCYQIKNNPLSQHISVILISAVSQLEKIARESCADNYLVKPFDIEEIQSMIKEYTELDLNH
jgi:DNA-binding response OmpR family regulator